MSAAETPLVTTKRVAATAVVVLLVGLVGFFIYRHYWPRGEALIEALNTLAQDKNPDLSAVATAIRGNYLETRTNAALWSGVYWGFTFLAAAMSAFAGLILKFESLVKNEATKKDMAAALSVCAALLITISSSGDFQRKWQANRIAAADIERMGYELLARPESDPRAYFAALGGILHQRHVSIVGSSQQRSTEHPASGAASGATP